MVKIWKIHSVKAKKVKRKEEKQNKDIEFCEKGQEMLSALSGRVFL